MLNIFKKVDLTGNTFLAYFSSVVSAIFSAVVFVNIKHGVSNFESATNFTFFKKVWDFVEFWGIISFVGFIFCSVTTAIPFFYSLYLATKFKIVSVWYFIFGGAITGVAISPLFILIIPRFGFNEIDGYESSFLEQFYAISPIFGCSGVIAGLTVVVVLNSTSKRN